MSLPHQDWSNVTFRKKAPPKKQIHINPIFKKMKELEENTEIPNKIETVSDEDKKLIITLRTQKKITQEALTKKMSLKKDTIKNIELGKYNKDNLLISRIKTFLINYKSPESLV